MKKFLIQTINGHIKHDFAFKLVQTLDFHNWFHNEKVYEYALSENVDGFPGHIPVGSLEFVFDYIEKYHQVSRSFIQPINIPASLQTKEFLGRNIYFAQKAEIVFEKPLFVKSNTQYKKITDVVFSKDNLPEDEYLVSELIVIESEWRAFVFRGELIGIQHYLGDFTIFPNIQTVKNMIQKYVDAPPAYTLDIGIVKEQNVIIEVHPFVSCGLYGFRDHKRLPIMFVAGFEYMLKQAQLKQRGDKK